MLGPVQRMRLCGTLCPFFESEEEHALRVADLLLNSVPIRWYRRVCVAPYPVGSDTLMNATDDIGCCGESHVPGSAREQCDSPTLTGYVGLDSTLDVIDTKYGPSICITTNDFSYIDDEDTGPIETNNRIMKKTVLLSEIRVASKATPADWEALGLPGLKDDGVIIYSKEPLENASDSASGKTKMQLVMQLTPGSKLSLSRNESLRHLNRLVAWDRIGPVEEDIVPVVPEKVEQETRMVPQHVTDLTDLSDVIDEDDKTEESSSSAEIAETVPLGVKAAKVEVIEID